MDVFFDSRQTAVENASFSPSAEKPAKVVDDWHARGLPIEICPVQPATVDELALAHDRQYVEGVLAGKKLNGFGNVLKAVAESLPWTTGSLLSAARHVAKTKGVACSPTSGFHHATYARGSGFCTFNGLVVAARVLHREGLAKRVGIIDLDMHYGNGTAHIKGKLKLEFLQHYTFGNEPISRRAQTPAKWLAALPGIVRKFDLCDFVIYQAGADPWEHDPLGGVLSAEEMATRDAIVFDTLHEMNVPVVWNLAGGYARDELGSIAPVLDLHAATAIACIRAFEPHRLPENVATGKNSGD